MYVILTSKPGQFHTYADAGMDVQERYEYRFYGAIKAIFEIAQMQTEGRVRIVEDEPPHITNSVPTKFLEKFETRDQAYAELEHLVRFGNMQAELIPLQSV